VSNLPLTGPDNLPTQHEGHPEHSIGGMEYRAISSQYFQTMSIPVLQGRGFQETDSPGSVPVAIVSESVARAWWHGRSPVGDRIIVGEYRGKRFPEVLEQPREVVGVVADVKNLTIDEPNPTTVYVPAAQLPRAPGGTAWVVKANAGLPVAKALRAAVLAVNPDQRIQDNQPLSDIVANSVARPTFNAFLMSTFAALALILTGAGVYGLLSYQVLRRTQEIGIRRSWSNTVGCCLDDCETISRPYDIGNHNRSCGSVACHPHPSLCRSRCSRRKSRPLCVGLSCALLCRLNR
jgi:hypothetical protein